MDFFEKMGETLSTKGKAATQKAKDLADLARLNAQVGQLEGKIRTWYQGSGEKVYHREKDQDHAGLEVEFDMVTEAFAQIGAIKKQIAALKGLQECPSCKAQVEDSAQFCPKCGAKLEDPWTVVDEDVCEADADSCQGDGEKSCGCQEGAPDPDGAQKEETAGKGETP